MRKMAHVFVLACAFLLSGCVSVIKVAPGERTVGEHLQISLKGAWNHIDAPAMCGPHCQVWTMEGLPIDQLLIYSGLENDQPIHADSGQSSLKAFRFRSGMQPDQIVALFEGLLTRNGSTFKLTKLEQIPFAGTKGFHFEFKLIRKTDNVELLGTGTATESKGTLFAIVYQAPRLMFYPKHQANVADIINSAKIK